MQSLAQADCGHRIICVQRNSAIVLPVSRCVTTASYTCVVRPRCCAVAMQSSVPSRAVPRKLDFSSIVVKPVAPSGRFTIQAYPQDESASVTTLPACR